MYKKLAIAALAGVVSAQDPSADTGAVTATFQGASGQMTFFSGDKELKISQSKIDEVKADGSTCTGGCTKFMTTGGTWSPVTEKDNVFSTTYTKTSGDISFSVTAHLAKLTSTAEEQVACSGCADGTKGKCKTDANQCSAISTNGTCADGASACTETVTVTEDQLKFSFELDGWTFKDQANALKYSITVKDKTPGSRETSAASSKSKSLAFGSGSIDLPATGKVKGGPQDKTVDATITVEENANAGHTDINFQFGYFDNGLSLYYDPTVALGSAASVTAGLALALPMALLALQ